MADTVAAEAVTPVGRFAIGPVLSRTTNLFSRGLGGFLLLALVTMSPILLFSIYLYTQNGVAPTPATMGRFGSMGVVAVLFNWVFHAIGQATILYAAFQQMRGQPFTFGRSMGVALNRALPVLAVVFVFGIAAGFATLLLIVPGIIVFCMFYVAVPVCVIEKPGVFASLGRSRALTKGYRWQIFGLVLVVGVVSALVSGVIQLLFAKLGGGIASVIAVFAWQVVITAFGSILIAVVYHDLRVAKEGVDTDKIAAVFA
jgi:hypothetical protein